MVRIRTGKGSTYTSQAERWPILIWPTMVSKQIYISCIRRTPGSQHGRNDWSDTLRGHEMLAVGEITVAKFPNIDWQYLNHFPKVATSLSLSLYTGCLFLMSREADSRNSFWRCLELNLDCQHQSYQQLNSDKPEYARNRQKRAVTLIKPGKSVFVCVIQKSRDPFLCL